ncbi:MAG: PQQ-binding-like beta-propeller repeat protein [candidate division Zixibacteria bacterium]
MSDIYSRYFANSRHDGWVNQNVTSGGDIAWRRIITGDEKVSAESRLLLSSDNQIVVDGMRKIFVYSSEGLQLWKRDKYYGCQVALQNDLINYRSADSVNLIHAVSVVDGKKAHDIFLSGITKNSDLVFFEPLEKGLVAQLQYTSSHDKPSDEMLIYLLTGTMPGFDWSCIFKGNRSPLIPLADIENRRFVTSIQGELVVFDLDSQNRTPEPVSQFPFPLEQHTAWMSCGKGGKLYFAGCGPKGLEVAIAEFNGELTAHSENLDIPPVKPIAPPILSDEHVFILTSSMLIAIKDGAVDWTFKPLRGNLLFGTALSDGSILVASTDMVYHLNEAGEYYFETVIDEPIVTPPVVDGNGQVFVASRDTLYAIG